MYGPLLLILFSGGISNLQAADPDIRVAKSHKDRGYNSVRISVVDKGAFSGDIDGKPFDYSDKFQRAWTDYTLHTTVEEVPGGSHTFKIGDADVKINLPKQGGQARCLFIADLCFNGIGGGGCSFGGASTKAKWDIEGRFTEAVIALVGSDEIDCWGILGDNFYENNQVKPGAPVSKKFYESLPLKVKAKPFITIPGNHDFGQYGLGTPASLTPAIDQGGYGFLQMYAQDVEFSLKDKKKPYDFSKPIGGAPQDPNTFPNHENFAFSHQIGDMAFLGWSGTAVSADFTPHLTKFCAWVASEATINTAVLVTHWNEVNDGCSQLDALNVYNQAKDIAGCKDKTLLFFDGHQHCNFPHESAPDNGFMIGGAGQWGGSGSGCAGAPDNGDSKRGIHQQWGFLVLDSDPAGAKGNAVRVDYFEVQNTVGAAPGLGGTPTDNWKKMSDCFKANKDTPVTSCRDEAFAFPWRKRPAPAPTPAPGPGPGPGPAPSPPATGKTTTALKKGDTTIPGPFPDFHIGDHIIIDAGSASEEENDIAGITSSKFDESVALEDSMVTGAGLTLKTPLAFAHAAGITLSVKPPGPTPGDPTDTPWLMIGGIVAAVLVVAAIIIFIVVSQRKKSEGLLTAAFPDALEVSGGQAGVTPADNSLQPVPARG